MDIITYLRTVDLILAERHAAAERRGGHRPAPAPRGGGIRRLLRVSFAR